MILQALHNYYERKPKIQTPIGYETEELDFIVLIKKSGVFVDLINKRENKRGHEYIVPKAVIRTAETKPNLLWDKLDYIFGVSKEKDSKKTANAKKYHKAFVNKLKNLPPNIKSDEGVKAVIYFYDKDEMKKVKNHPLWEECVKINGWISFQLEKESEIIPVRKIVQEYQKTEFLSGKTDDNPIEGTCLITGEKGIIARLHTELRLRGSDKNVKIVAFQKNSGFDSYGKEQAYNAPISVQAEAAYSTALKHLLNSSTNKTFIGDTTTVFWSEKTSKAIDLEEVVSWVIATQKSNEDDPDKKVQIVERLFDSIYTGKISLDKDCRFNVLGLAPNAARIAVRFWRTGTVEEFGKKIYQHFKDFDIEHASYEPKYLSLYQILSSTAFQYKMENVPPNLAANVVESILDGTPYPETLMQQCIRRIRAEVARKDIKGKLLPNVNRTRAAILKAYLNRINKNKFNSKKEISMAYNPEYDEVGYVLGSLFALLEKIQEDAAKPNRLNSTIRERYYSSLSSSPIAVLPSLMRLKNHHLAKLNGGLRHWYETKLAEIMKLLDAKKIPAHLTLEQQSLFAVGYYHRKIHTDKKESISK